MCRVLLRAVIINLSILKIRVRKRLQYFLKYYYKNTNRLRKVITILKIYPNARGFGVLGNYEFFSLIKE